LACRKNQPAPAGLQRHAGHLVDSGRLTTPFNNVYAATKFGVVAFCDSMRQEMADKGLRVTVIEPGMTRGTEITNAPNPPELQRFIVDFLANAVTLSPEDIAATVVHMVSQPRTWPLPRS
jgi:NADP-dependent 3-hydroxy acid dehydrogenase YdfG